MMLRPLLLLILASEASGFVSSQHRHHHAVPTTPIPLQDQQCYPSTATSLMLGKNDNTGSSDDNNEDMLQKFRQSVQVADGAIKSVFLAAALSIATWSAPVAVPTAVAATDPGAIVGCLLSKCQVQFAKCITNPGCLANVICINSCNDKDDETGCQIKCGDIFDNAVIGEFNKCAVSDMSCVPQKPDEGLYPEPTHAQMVPDFKTKFFDGKLYITAGLNPLFDIFPCQVHFFTESSPGTFFGKLNWDIVEPDGELFTRDALQQFVQDPKEPAHLINHDNEYLHYKDDWYIIDYEYADNKDGIPPFAFVYYRGSNDAWDGYGGVVTILVEELMTLRNWNCEHDSWVM
ncbi:Violaxanthin de-epoxidase, chloroplastic [Seminavis robusta]|uniref:Violaxanthin de-epoxidase, chloroplastic n=1 Tax=Seminavis robusta TaxID=568900 RepID=A0A9N8E8J7_9STRA|nr:Violaxanthin de-epoxidase, chloroplastic [Seminavis robusta]|eukprot:Sro665_g183760.1 Violaxanthin de-epoxidase, chloroplastic (346) ;mRNA; r:758-1895